jgi:hypothetical protein
MTAQGVVVRLTDRRGDVIAAVKAPLKDPSHDIGAEVAAEKMAAHHDEHAHTTRRWPSSRTSMATHIPFCPPDPTLHYGDMHQLAVLGADFAPLKVLARDLGGLTALQELVRESPPAQLIDGIKLVLRENEIFQPRMWRRAAGGS